MADLVDELYVGLTGQTTDAGLSMGDLLVRLVAVAGTGKAAAKALGVSPTTFYRWRRGVQQPKVKPDMIRATLRRQLLKPNLERQIRSKQKTLHIHGTITVSGDTRPRTLKVGNHIPATTMGRILNTWLRGEDDKVSTQLWNAIDKHYLRDIEIDALTGVEFK